MVQWSYGSHFKLTPLYDVMAKILVINNLDIHAICKLINAY